MWSAVAKLAKLLAQAVTGLGDASNVLKYTPGIDILEADVEEVGHLKVHDVASHNLFQTTHSFLVKCLLCLNVVITDLSK